MKAIRVEISGKAYFLVFNGAAMFAFDDEFGGYNAYFEQTKDGGRAAFGLICKAAAILSEQGELVRRELGYDNAPMLTTESALVLATPMDMIALRKAVMDAIVAGFDREVSNDGYIDLGLMELEQKKTGK
jgi:hypothetical protein|nr:MAG TPA: hypothetical protein [Caudoviricetes sp.]